MQAEGELVITKVITTLLQRYAGSDVCDASSLFLDVGANSGWEELGVRFDLNGEVVW
jgi:hypothetical protein